MKQKLILILFLILTGITTSAQTSHKFVSGTIIDESKEPIIGAVIVMLDSDSTYISSVATDEKGSFKLKVKHLPYRLLCQHISFQQKEIISDSENLGQVTLLKNTTSLNEVTIKGERPVMKIEGGKLSYDIQAIAKNKTANNAYEAITRLPGVSEKDDIIKLAGAGKVNIILNGKLTSMTPEQLADILRATPIERVEKAEIMYSTPPQYHVKGASINIVMKKHTDNSVTGEVHGNYANRYYNSWDAGGNIVFSSPHWNADLTYSGGEKTTIRQIELISRHTLGNTVHDIRQNQKNSSIRTKHDLRASLEYTFANKSNISLSYTAGFSPRIHSFGNGSGNFVSSNVDSNGESSLNNVSLSYNSSFGLKAGVDYTNYYSSRNALNKNQYTANDVIFNLFSSQEVNRISTYVDQSHEIDNDWGITYGAKSELANNFDKQKYTILQGELDYNNTNSRLKEYVFNAYAGFSKKFEKGDLSLSLMGEYYKLGSFSRWSIFPQANFTWEFDDINGIQASFSSDKQYPTYIDMQNSVSYIDGYAELHGTPGLRPMRKYNAQLMYIFKKKYMVSLFWKEEPDHLDQTMYQTPDRLAVIYQTFNWNYAREYGVTITVPFTIGNWLSSNVSLTGSNYVHRLDKFYDISFNRSMFTVVGEIDNSIKISQKPNITLNVYADYYSPGIHGTYDLKTNWSINVGAKWTFLNDRATLSARCTDIFQTSIPLITIRHGLQNLDNTFLPDTRTVSVYFSYRFGSYKKVNHKKVDSSRFSK